MKFALIGKSLEHSFSQSYFSAKFEREKISASYENLEFDSEVALMDAWPELITQFDGFNITLPYKKTLLKLVDSLDPHALSIGAINCIVVREGKTYGYNTDFQGFYKSVYKKSFSRHRKALIVGHGGAALAVQYAIELLLKMPVDIISRDQEDIPWSHIEELDLKEYSLVVQTTPIGMFPHSDACPPLRVETALQDTLFVDLIYNPMITILLEKADSHGCMILNGLPMLHAQAEMAWDLWSN